MNTGKREEKEKRFCAMVELEEERAGSLEL